MAPNSGSERPPRECRWCRPVKAALAALAARWPSRPPTLTAIVLLSFASPVRAFLFEEKLTPAMAQEDARRTLTALVAEIESFRHDYNELPETLVEIGVPSRGRWTYTASGKSLYRLKGSVQGQHVAFDSLNEGAR